MKDIKKQTGTPGKGQSDKKSKKVNNSTQKTGTPTSSSKGNAPKMWDDDRFAHLINNPRYHGIPKSKKKVTIDNRFKAMFEDERFNQKATMDKYGRKIKKTDSDMLRKFYHLESEEEEENEEEVAREREREERALEGRAGSSDSESDIADGLQLTQKEKKAALSGKVKTRLNDKNVDFARGEGMLGSESSSDDDSDGDEGEEDVFIEHVWGELDAEAERTEESTRRLAVCHMDWDRIRAVDVMVLLSSFLPPGSAIKSVTIYPSEYGKQRMKEEEERGPQELTAQKIENSDEEEAEDEEAQKERLREYQLNRLKYYYAVAECDSVATADKIYKECDGIEYESTANKLDLRFIPDDMEFDDEPKDHCSELPEVGKYVPRIFATTALHQAKVELTWDENDLDRKEFNDKLRDGKWADLPEAELKKYVVCSSSDEEGEDDGKMTSRKSKRPVVRIQPPRNSVSGSDEENEDGTDSDGDPKGRRKVDMIAKYRALLSDIKEQEKAEEEDQVGMEFTWKVNGADKEAPNERSDSESDNEAANAREDDVNPFEKILLKKKEKNKRRKELKKRRKRGELDGTEGEANEDDTSEDDRPYGVDLNDPFFASAFDEKEFDLSNKKKNSKQKDREAIKQAKEEEEREAAESARRRAELELMLDDGEDNRAHFNLRAIQEREIDLRSVSKSKRRALLKKSRREIEEQRNSKAAADDFEVDAEDPRFGAIYSKPDYNIDPTNPAFKKTKAMERLIETKLRKRQLAENDVREENGKVVQQQDAKVARKDVSTTMLVKSIKRKIGKAS
uniref:Uncharacterized protein n=1 Tax=Anopheles christyi TaxID=43041 RepID=A0A182JSN5_9DIPT